jgi:hypothetical protein
MVDRRVDKVERPRDEGVHVSPIVEEKKGKQNFSDLPQQRSEKLLMATFFAYIKKIFEKFSPSKKIAGKVVDIQGIIEHIQSFRKILEKLTAQNLSSSSEYAKQLSDAWVTLSDDLDQIQIMHRKDESKTDSFRKMIDAIKHFPKNSEHRFGYYLLQHAGKDWLPFPFIEILEALHQNHLEDPKSSTLNSWFHLFDEVIKNLKQGLPFKGF